MVRIKYSNACRMPYYFLSHTKYSIKGSYFVIKILIIAQHILPEYREATLNQLVPCSPEPYSLVVDVLGSPVST